MTKNYQASIEDFYSAYGAKFVHQVIANQGNEVLVKNIKNLLRDDIKGYDYLISAVREVLASDAKKNTINIDEIKDKDVKKHLLKSMKVFGAIRLNMALQEAREQIVQHQMGWDIDNALWKISLTEINTLLTFDPSKSNKLNLHNIKDKKLKKQFEEWAKDFGASAVRRRIKKCLPEIVSSRFIDLLSAKNMYLDPIEAFRLVEEDLHEHEGKSMNSSKSRE